jgi:integrase/recombinase XerD
MLEELQRRNYSQTTVNGYLKVVAAFAKHFNRPPDQLGPEQIRAYQVYLFNERKLNARTVGHHTAALRFFYCKTLKRAYPVEEVPYPKAPRRLPTILTQEEAVRLINSASKFVSSRHVDDGLLDWHAPGRGLPPKGGGYR